MALDNIDRDDIRCWCEHCQEAFPVDEFNENHIAHHQEAEMEGT